MDEMINFAVLFMPRTTENIQKYICVAIGWVETQCGMLKFSRIQNSYTRITGHFLWTRWENMSEKGK